MNRRFPWRAAAALLCVLLIPAAACLFPLAAKSRPARDPGTCLGLPILGAMPAVHEGGEAPQVLYQGLAAPLDESTRTLYLTVAAPEGCTPGDLSGKLAAKDSGISLAFAPDAAFSDLPAAIADGHVFRLLALRGGAAEAEFSVVFTPLPVICMDTAYDSDYDDPYALHSGRIRVFETGGAGDSQAGWHRRGMSTRLFKKGSWKLSVTNDFDRPRNFAIAGLGADDDWILNSMGMDDLKLREMLVTTLWNQMQRERGSALRMADCAYSEVILDGEYMGLYLLQRRVDTKYLGLEKSRDIVLKGSNIAGAKSALDAFTVKSAPMDSEKAAMLAQPLVDLSDVSNVDLDTWLDFDAFLLFGAMYDNRAIRNAYYLLSPEDGTYRISLLPWDTDISFGLGYVQKRGHVLLPLEEESLPLSHRREYDALSLLYPDLDARIAARWQSLRGGVLSDENVKHTLSAIRQALQNSGAYARDAALWEPRYHGEDAGERFDAFLDLRLQQVDAAYLKNE